MPLVPPYIETLESASISSMPLPIRDSFYQFIDSGWGVRDETAIGEPVQAVLPAPLSVDLGRLRALAHASTLRLAREDEVAHLYPDCEPGAMPPFGPMYHQRVFVEESLGDREEIVFNAGTHRDAIRMGYRDFVEVANAIVGHFGRPRAES